VAEYPIVIILVQDELVAERLSFVGNVEAKCCRPQTSEEDREVQTVVTLWLTTGQDSRKACLTMQQVRKLWRGLRGKLVARQYR